MANDVMIEATGLTKFFGGFRALDRVSFQVRRGEVVGFLGPNGAGKSTTMRILTCFISATAGTAKVHGLDAFDDPVSVRRKLGYLPQRAPLYGEMTVWDYLRFCSEMRGIDESTFKSRMKKVVEVCGLARVLGKDIRNLSHGYRQRVGLGQALVHDPPILILDEPTSDLDPNERAEVIRYIQETGKNRTILLSTHNLNEVEAVCARAIIVSKGRVVADGPLDEIRAVSGGARYLVTIHGKQTGARGGVGYREAGERRAPTAQECQEALRALPTVTAVRELPAVGEVHRFEVRASRKTDLRAEIFHLAVDKGWLMLELTQEADTLEDSFKALTREDERGDRGLGRQVPAAFSPIASAAGDEDEDEDDEDDDDDDDDDATAKALSDDHDDEADEPGKAGKTEADEDPVDEEDEDDADDEDDDEADEDEPSADGADDDEADDDDDEADDDDGKKSDDKVAPSPKDKKKD